MESQKNEQKDKEQISSVTETLQDFPEQHTEHKVEVEPVFWRECDVRLPTISVAPDLQNVKLDDASSLFM